MRRAAVVIVTYNSAGVLQGCLDSLPPGAKGVELAEVVVADNASKDDSVAIAEKAGATVVRVGRNAGYAAAINAGIARLDLDRLDGVYVLNPDCRLRPGAIAPLLDSLREPGRGIAVPYMVNPDGTLQPSLRRMPTVGRALVEAVVGGGLAGRIGTLGELVTDPRDYAEPGAFAWATGAAMLLSPQVIRDVGPWDESFLLYSEETDYCLRAADLGYATWYEPASVIEHIGGDSGVNPMLASMLVVNKVRLYRRRHGPVSGTAYYLTVLAGEAVRALAGRRTSRASVAALLRPSRRLTALPQ
ncbi:glycosyl transferase, family 2 [[Actinomadura] parvosata subsp. kistnae]|uniref:Glycosyl transferase family 2 n=1 Tax=[Actinomadura] parvosata subsp. kistnae TaxID=1909395 RepID=A0A1V0AAN5_9ACTN|nr:glycosyltransferase family 2 protein [Nonomuraea sp. ATCC 55076]AQZ67280.1 glycosyl transferase family 2 [Nonomuraea sp. ATCC 55076]SPL94497.1 glycosyl transferase, family 2 [Actinomadura parvosata subsp. kistnae]